MIYAIKTYSKIKYAYKASVADFASMAYSVSSSSLFTLDVVITDPPNSPFNAFHNYEEQLKL